MRRPIRRPARPVAVLLAAAALALVAAPAAAKQALEARLDAPVPMGVPGGTELLVGVTVTELTEDGERPVEGTPVYLKLFGPDGSFTRAAGAADRTPGRYTMRIVVPEGGARDIEIGIDGTTDLAIMVLGTPLTIGGVTPATAQVAPPLRELTPLPRSAAGAVSPPAAPSVSPTVAPAAPAGPGVAPLLVALALAVAGVLLAGVARARRTRGSAPGPSSPSSAPTA